MKTLACIAVTMLFVAAVVGAKESENFVSYIEAKTGSRIILFSKDLVFDWNQPDIYQGKGLSRKFRFKELKDGELFLVFATNELATPKADLRIHRRESELVLTDRRRSVTRRFVKQD